MALGDHFPPTIQSTPELSGAQSARAPPWFIFSIPGMPSISASTLREAGEKRATGQLHAERLGDAEIDDFDDGPAIFRTDKNVRRFEVAVDDPFLVRMLNGGKHIQEEVEALAGGESFPIAVVGDRSSASGCNAARRRQAGHTPPPRFLANSASQTGHFMAGFIRVVRLGHFPVLSFRDFDALLTTSVNQGSMGSANASFPSSGIRGAGYVKSFHGHCVLSPLGSTDGAHRFQLQITVFHLWLQGGNGHKFLHFDGRSR